MSNWKPGTSVSTLRARADLLRKIRRFFSQRDVLEVETPLLAKTGVTDLHIESWQTKNLWGPDQRPLYLQTSPEYAMKRLLASGSGAIFQLAKAFRFEEPSSRHNPEFTMLEWYQPGYSLDSLMNEVEELVREVTELPDIERLTYRDLFNQALKIDPHSITTDELERLARSKIDLSAKGLSRTDYLQLLLSQVIEPTMQGNWFLYDYPAEQAALAAIEVDEQGVEVAKRFELFCSGMEIANGYFELTDPVEQRRRFASDLDRRAEAGLDAVPVDDMLIAALESGLPDCAGVALGVDRLLMLITGADSISDVISFTTDQA